MDSQPEFTQSAPPVEQEPTFAPYWRKKGAWRSPDIQKIAPKEVPPLPFREHKEENDAPEFQETSDTPRLNQNREIAEDKEIKDDFQDPRRDDKGKSPSGTDMSKIIVGAKSGLLWGRDLKILAKTVPMVPFYPFLANIVGAKLKLLWG